MQIVSLRTYKGIPTKVETVLTFTFAPSSQ
jgi:hypothetical protein